MLKHFFLHTYTQVVLIAALTTVVYGAGYTRTAIVMGLVMLCFTIAKGMYRNESMTRAYEVGLCIGIASLVWHWSLIAFLFYLVFLYGPMRVSSLRIVWTSCLGLLTPLWCYAPYWIYNNMDNVTTIVLNAKDTLI